MASSSRVVFRLGLVLAVVVGAALIGIFAFRPVAQVSKVVPGKAIDQVPGSVVVRAEYSTQLKSEGGGRVIESHLDAGKMVNKGEFLVQLDPTDLQLEIDRLESDLKAAQEKATIGPLSAIDLEGAKADLVNAERQFKLGSISEAELQKQQRLVNQFEKRVQLEGSQNEQAVAALENQLKTKKRQLEKTRITAYFDGKISEVLAYEGDLIGPSTPLATIISTKRTVEAKISEENFANIKIDKRARVRFLGYGNQLYDAKVIKVLPTADPETQRYIVHLDVAIDPELLVPGITGEVTIVVSERDSRTIMPRRALFQNSVFVVADGKVEQRKVEVGYTSLNQVEIVKGVKEGDLVIVEDLDRFQPGDRVRTKLVN